MATYTGTTGNDSWTVVNPGTFSLDGLAGTDTLYLGTSLRSSYTITKSSDGAVHIDSISSASGALHATLYNMETLVFANKTDTLDLTTYFGGTLPPPTVTITDNVSGTATGNVTYSLAFSRAVTGLAANDFTVTNGAVVSVAGSGSSYSVLVAPNANTEGSLGLTLNGGAVLDAALNPNAATAASVQPIDTRPPVVSVFTPADQSMAVAIAADITVTFSEAIHRGTGNIVLKTAAGVTVATYDAATSTNLSISGAVLTLNPGADLANGTHYVVEFAAGSITDLAGNAYAGSTSYGFTTVGLTVTVSNGDNLLQGTAGNDTFTIGLGNNTVNAGAGVDTVVLPMFPNAYSLTESTPGHVTGHYAGYTLALNDVETVQFGTTFQTTIPLSSLVSGDAQLQLGRLTDLYLAFFGRAPDVSGLEYWQEQLLEKGRDLTSLAKDFAWSTEAQALFPQAASNRDFVQTVYLNSFGRQPDAGGWDFWTAKLNGLGTTDLNDRGAFVGEVILGAYAPSSGAADQALLTNRHEAAMYYVNQLSNTPAEGFDAAINTLLAKVSGDAATLTRAEHVIDYAFAHPVTLTGVMTDAVLMGQVWGV